MKRIASFSLIACMMISDPVLFWKRNHVGAQENPDEVTESLGVTFPVSEQPLTLQLNDQSLTLEISGQHLTFEYAEPPQHSEESYTVKIPKQLLIFRLSGSQPIEQSLGDRVADQTLRFQLSGQPLVIQTPENILAQPVEHYLNLHVPEQPLTFQSAGQFLEVQLIEQSLTFLAKAMNVEAANPSDTTSGIIVRETDDELVLDMEPCSGRLIEFHDPYNKQKTGNTIVCGKNEYDEYQVEQR